MLLRTPAFTLLTACALLPSLPAAQAPHQMEYLDRGLVALRTGPGQVLLSWRLLGSDPEDTRFVVYRSDDGGPPMPLHELPRAGSTQFVDATADLTRPIAYHVRPVQAGTGQALSEPAWLPANAPERSYFRVPLQKPADQPDDGTVGSHSYAANDCSVADLDGDGAYEIVVKWDPSNAKDNSQSGHTGRVLLDAYELDGTRLWRIDLGRNVRAGAHYTQFLLYDFDGDGRAELACRTAPGATDGQGDDVAAPDKWQNAGGPARPVFSPTNDYRNGAGYVLSGPEFLTLFDGATGDELVSTSYVPFRDPDNSLHSPGTSRINQVWGDGYGNRIDRFLAGVAYLDGERPSLVMCRGYYTRSFLVAWDWRDGQLSRRWVFDSDDPGHGGYAGQGAHSLTVGDVDADGRDEIVYGACTVDDDGSGLYTTGLVHGDALHLSDMDPTRPGLEVWMVHESPSNYGVHGSELHDAATGEILFSVDASDDIGRGVAADIDPRTLGYEAWSSRANLHNAVTGSQVTGSRPGPMNFLCWWDGDLTRELLDGTTISKWNWNSNNTSNLLSPSGVSSNNGSKSTPCLSADLFGDWREEVVWRESDSSALRIYTSTIPTRHALPTLMHDRQYRLAIAWQNVGYNQPPHPGFYLGEGMEPAPRPVFDVVAPAGVAEDAAQRFQQWLSGRGLDPGLDPRLDHDGNGMTLQGEYAFDATLQVPIAIRREGGSAILDVASVRDEFDYVVERSTGLGGWTPLARIAGTPGVRTEVEVPITGDREIFRAVAVADYPVETLSLRYEAESAEAGPQEWAFENNNPGYNGSGYINFDTDGSYLEFRNVDGGPGGQAELAIRYALGSAGTRSGLLVVNGFEQPITFVPTGSWSTWSEHRVTVSLDPGATNTVRLESNGEDLANIDELTVTVYSVLPAEASVALRTPLLEPHQAGRIFVIGDSTVANYGGSYAPQKGWGQVLHHFVEPDRFSVTNRARGGRSSKSFIVEGLWDGLKAELRRGDCLLIQWGHNDRDWTRPERYTSETEYKDYLARYVDEARSLGVVPVFVTPMVMNAWNGDTMRNVFTESGNDYAGWMKQVAAELDVPLIDLNEKSHAFFRVLDYDTAGRFYYHTYLAGEYPNWPSGSTDGTHFQEMGALLMAKFVAEGFRELDPDPRVSALANGLKAQYPLAIQANLPAAGRVSLGTELPEGANFHLKALPGEGHSFAAWKDGDDQLVGSIPLMTFAITPGSHRFTAYFDDQTPVPPPAEGSMIPGGVPFDYAITLSADAVDPDSPVVRVEFFDDATGEKIAESGVPPFEAYWEAPAGVHRVRAESVNEAGDRLASEILVIDTEAPNLAPAATMTGPADGSLHLSGDSLVVTAGATDPDGRVARVIFEVDGVYLGEDDTAPYSVEWSDIPGGIHTLSVVAVDDRGAVSPASSVEVEVSFDTAGQLLQEAESATLAGSFIVVNDAAASGGQAVEAVSGPADANYAEFRFNVPTTGNYVLRARIKAVDGNHDSMFVSVDGGAADGILWDTARSTTYVDDYVSHRGGADPVVFNLAAGMHTVRLGYRENLFLDLVELEPAP